ncbi:MAG: hypothetical protein Q9196_000758 [Gyalolechia fulgens]
MPARQSRIVKLHFTALQPQFAREIRLQELISPHKTIMSPRDIMRFLCETASYTKETLESYIDKQNTRLETCLDYNELLQRENEKLSKRNESRSKPKAKTSQQLRLLAKLKEQVRMTEKSTEERGKLQERESQLRAELMNCREELMKCREDLVCTTRHLNEATQEQEQQRARLESKDRRLEQILEHLTQQASLLKKDRRLYIDLVEEHRRELRQDQALSGKLREMPRSKAVSDVQECHDLLRDTSEAARKDKEGKLRMESALVQIGQLCASQEEGDGQGGRMDLDIASMTDLGWEAVGKPCDDNWLILSGITDKAL